MEGREVAIKSEGPASIRPAMKPTPIFNLDSVWNRPFQIGAYQFSRVASYEQEVAQLYRAEKLQTSWHSDTGKETTTVIPGQRGAHACTYTATGPAEEPKSLLFAKGGTQLIDIVFVMRLFLGRGIYLEHELGTFPPHYQGELLVHDPYFIDEISRVLKEADWDRARKANLGPSLYYYFRSCTTDMINFTGADLAIAWDILATNYATAYPPLGKAEFLTRKAAALDKLKPALAEISGADQEMANRLGGTLGNVSFDYLADQAVHLIGAVGLLDGLDRERAVKRIRTFVSHVRGKLIHSGEFPVPKQGWTDRAQRYSIFAMRALYALVCARLLGVRETYYPIEEQLKDMKTFFGAEDPTFRGERPFTEKQSRFEEQLRTASSKDGSVAQPGSDAPTADTPPGTTHPD